MHEHTILKCVFGCRDQEDSQKHYLECAPLWMIASEAAGLQSPPLDLSKRLCMVSPTPQDVMCVALAFHAYHYTKSLCHSNFDHNGVVQNPCELQRAATESGRTFFHHLS